MNKENIFDDITRITARAGVDISRRKALSWIVGTLAYGALGGIGLSRKALAADSGACIILSQYGTGCFISDQVYCNNSKAVYGNTNWVGSGTKCCGNPAGKAYTPSTPTNCKCTGVTGMSSTPALQDSAKCSNCGGKWEGCTGVSGSFSGGTISFSSNCGFSNVSASGDNCTWSISGYNCTTGRVTVTATKIDTSKSASIYATAYDCSNGSSGVDPVMTTLSLTTGRWVRQTFTDIPKAESYISVTNNNPGLKTLDIRVNSHYHKTLELRTNETKTINVAEAMTTGNHNTVSLMGQGKLGASADVTISDTPPPSQPNTKISHDKKLSHRENNIWGHIAEELHETSDFHNADVSTQTVLITFKGDLDSFSAGNIGLYNVDVNGRPVVVQKANAQPQADGVELLLQLPRNTLKNGNTVDVYWEYLQDKEGQPLAGHVSLIAQRSH
ncbi:MAG: hypothetical protein WCG16_09265 [Methylococcales bacterium]